jgi:hypothetical protein
MGQLHAFEEDTDGRMMAVVNRPQGAAHRRYDITEAIRTVEALTLASAESALRERLALRPAAERHGRILRLRQGATLLRSKGEGWFNTQPLIGAGDRLGNNAWVREIRRSGSKLFVEPVNADAHQAVALAPTSSIRIWKMSGESAKTAAARCIRLNCPASETDP